MGERQVKKNRKNQNDMMPKRKASKTEVITNIVIAVVIVGVLGLGVYAVGSRYMENHPADSVVSEQSQTIGDYIAEKGITLDEFKTEYGVSEGITESTAVEEVVAGFTLENYAKYLDITLDELKSQYGLGDDVPNTIVWQDAIAYMRTEAVAQNFGNTDFETFKAQMGLPDDITADTPWSETEAVISEMSQQSAEEDNTEAAEDDQSTDE